jgi:hypothetical protein
MPHWNKKLTFLFLTTASFFGALLGFQYVDKPASAQSGLSQPVLSPVSPASARTVSNGHSNERDPSFNPFNQQKAEAMQKPLRLQREFAAKYGPALQFEMTADGRLASVREGNARSIPVRNFRAGDHDAVLAAAKQVLEDARNLIKAPPDLEVQSRQVQSDDVSSQVDFVQAKDGVPLAPYGKLTVQFDSSGGLRALYSDYISDIRIVNPRTLSEDTARQKMLDAISSDPAREGRPSFTSRGEAIIYIPAPQISAEPVPAHHAYRFWLSGREVILDASTGDILFQRDRREF